jgi:hypothetical protein
MANNNEIDRRDILRTTGSAIAGAGLTGCLSGENSDEGRNNTDERDSTEAIAGDTGTEDRLELPDSGVFEYENLTTGGPNGRELHPVPLLITRDRVGEDTYYDIAAYTGQLGTKESMYNEDGELAKAAINEAIILDEKPEDLESLKFGDIFGQLESMGYIENGRNVIEYNTGGVEDVGFTPSAIFRERDWEGGEKDNTTIVSIRIENYDSYDSSDMVVIAEDRDIPYFEEKEPVQNIRNVVQQYQKRGKIIDEKPGDEILRELS